MIGTLIVSKEEMLAAAAELSGYVSHMENCFMQMKQTMERTNGYWTGDAGDAHRQLYLEQIETTEEMIARYQEHVADLNEMAGRYKNAEDDIAAMIGALVGSDL